MTMKPEARAAHCFQVSPNIYIFYNFTGRYQQISQRLIEVIAIAAIKVDEVEKIKIFDILVYQIKIDDF